MKSNALYALAFLVVAIGALLFLAWAAQRTLEKGLPPKDASAANRNDGFSAAHLYAQENGGAVYGVLGTGSMSPFIPAGKADEIVAYAVTRKVSTIRDVTPGDVCLYRSGTGTVIHGAAQYTSEGWIMSGLGNSRHDIRMNGENFVGIVAKVFVWKS